MGEINSVIKNIPTYIEKVNSFEPKVLATNLIFKPITLFRGLKNIDYKYLPKIGRNNGTYKLILNEQDMIKDARLRMPVLFENDKYPVQILSKLQHYGLPTRLLDFTVNPLVALYFAVEEGTAEENNADGKVLLYVDDNEKISDCYNPFINAIADISLVSKYMMSSFTDYIKRLDLQEYWKFPDYENVKLSQKVDRLKKPLIFFNEANTERIRRQDGTFMIFPNKIVDFKDDKYIFDSVIDEWQPQIGHYHEYRIKSNDKPIIRENLSKLGIKRSYLFPEIENICIDILKKYK